jgi:hypothetical protein
MKICMPFELSIYVIDNELQRCDENDTHRKVKFGRLLKASSSIFDM